MTPEQYQDAQRFPQSTQPELKLKDQLFIDASNWDWLEEVMEEKGVWNDEQIALRKELEQKKPHRAELMAIAKQQNPPVFKPGALTPEEKKELAASNRKLMAMPANQKPVEYEDDGDDE